MTEIQPLAEAVARLLVEQSWTITVGEIDTGGLIGSRLMAVPGATRFFKGGVICYGGAFTRDVLQVSAELIQEKGMVSAEVTLEVAKRVRALADADVALGESGIAGPTGRQPGLVYIALATRDGREVVVEENWDSPDRYGNMQRTAERALRLVRDFLEGRG